MKSVDKSAWQTTLAYYRAWNDAKRLEQVPHAGRKTPAQKWHEFLSLMEFGLKIKPSPSKHEHWQKIDMLNQYYEKIRQFEQWRKQHGKSSA